MVQLDASFREHFIPAYFQFGLHQQNAEQVISKLFDHIGSRSVDEILVRGKRSTIERMVSDPVQTMKQVKDLFMGFMEFLEGKIYIIFIL
jgi:hypothetical protein